MQSIKPFQDCCPPTMGMNIHKGQPQEDSYQYYLGQTKTKSVESMCISGEMRCVHSEEH